MTPEQIDLVKTSWAKVRPAPDAVAEMFYTRLFELDPSVMPMFKVGMQEQGAKLVRMIDATVAGLERFDNLAPVVEDLGRRHVSYGTLPEHYDTVGVALLWTLEQGLGREFTPEVRDAWAQAYTALADTMKQAAPEAVV
ncbi:MAG: hemin receptor [Pseudomonadota bacterium]|nr:MAG: hemin receptor [Pseudomonadota bacterium]